MFVTFVSIDQLLLTYEKKKKDNKSIFILNFRLLFYNDFYFLLILNSQDK